MANSTEHCPHYPVLHRQLIPLLGDFCSRGWVVDATVGLGGHSERLLASFPAVKVLALDADGDMLDRARHRLARWGDRVHFCHRWFDDFFGNNENRAYFGGQQVGGVMFDFGINQAHYQESKRGFALTADEDLDMRLDPSAGRSAGELVRRCSAVQLEDLFRKWGEERFARSIARRIVRERHRCPRLTARWLAEVIASAVPPLKNHRRQFHPATRCFQALRIAVNDEVGRLQRALPLSFNWLCDGGLLACISFHSLEDRPVKHFFLSRQHLGEGRMLHRKPLRPSEEELRENRASRSARLRVLQKGGADVLA